MLKLTSSFSKKVPVAGADYSSQSYHAAVEVELPDGLTPEQLRQRIHETFELVRGSVEAELSGKPANSATSPAAPTAQAEPVQPPPVVESVHPAIPPVMPVAPTGARVPTESLPGRQVHRASGKQVSFLTELATRKRIPLAELLAETQKLYGVAALEGLTRQQASKLIERLSAALDTRRVAA